MKNEGHNYSNATLKLLLKILHKQNIIKHEITEENFHPKNTFEKQLKYMNEKNEKIECIELITLKLEELFDRHESYYKEKKDDDVEEVYFMIKKLEVDLKKQIIDI